MPPTLNWDIWFGPAPTAPITRAICRVNGTSGGISAAACWATWAATSWTCPSGLSSCVIPTTIERRRAAGPSGDHPADHDDPLRVSRPRRDAAGQPHLVSRTQVAARRDRPVPAWGTGFLFIGDQGMLLADYTRRVLLPEAKFAGYQPPEPSIPDSLGHYAEWVAACKAGSPTGCNFDYAGALTEAMLLGNVAYRAGKKLQWDAASLKATNCPEADPFIRREYRKGWTL